MAAPRSRRGRHRWAALLVLPLAGCSWFSDTATLRLRFPEPPEHWKRAFPEIEYLVMTPDVEEILTEARIPKKNNWPVLAYPLVRGLRLPPAGALYPLDLETDSKTLALAWERGPQAEILLALIRQGTNVSSINVQRLAREMSARSSGDPWKLDLAHIAEHLASGSFRETDIRLLSCRDVELCVGAGGWFLESPFQLPIRSVAGEPLRLPAVSLGFHRLIAEDGAGGYSLEVTEKETYFLPW